MANSRTKADARHRVNVCTYSHSRRYIGIKIKDYSVVVVTDSFLKKENDQAKDVSWSMYSV